ncbi:MAG: hypothetical protein ABWX74_03035 [Aeromicrobium sp.]
MSRYQKSERNKPGQVFDTVSSTMRSNTTLVLEESARRDVPPHEAAWNLAQE